MLGKSVYAILLTILFIVLFGYPSFQEYQAGKTLMRNDFKAKLDKSHITKFYKNRTSMKFLYINAEKKVYCEKMSS